MLSNFKSDKKKEAVEAQLFNTSAITFIRISVSTKPAARFCS